MTEERVFVLQVVKLLVNQFDYEDLRHCSTENLKELCLNMIETRVLSIDYLISRLEHFDKVVKTDKKVLKFDMEVVNKAFDASMKKALNEL